MFSLFCVNVEYLHMSICVQESNNQTSWKGKPVLSTPSLL